MGGAINLQGGGQYQAPNVTGTSQPAPSVSNAAARFNRRMDYEPTYDVGGFGGYGDYGGGYGGYGNYGGGYGGYNQPSVSTGGKGFQQQQYQPAPVLNPYVDTVSTGGKGMQSRQTPSQATAYAPMYIPQMSFAQPAYYYPSVAGQMANLSANYGMGGLGAMGAYQPLISRPRMSYRPDMGTQYGTQQYMPQQQYRQPPPQQQQPLDQNRLNSLLSSLFGFGSPSYPPAYQPPSQPPYSYNPPTSEPTYEPPYEPTPTPTPTPASTPSFGPLPVDFSSLTNYQQPTPAPTPTPPIYSRPEPLEDYDRRPMVDDTVPVNYQQPITYEEPIRDIMPERVTPPPFADQSGPIAAQRSTGTEPSFNPFAQQQQYLAQNAQQRNDEFNQKNAQRFSQLTPEQQSDELTGRAFLQDEDTGFYGASGLME